MCAAEMSGGQGVHRGNVDEGFRVQLWMEGCTSEVSSQRWI